MDQERIWAPWRLGYIKGDADDILLSPPEPTAWQPGADHECFLCRASASYADQASADKANLVVRRGQHTVTLLNRYPYSNGHLLVAPLRHVGELHELTAEEHLEAMQTLADFTQLLSKLISAAGFNVGLNLGQVAGAGVPGHLHWHLVPRWPGDNNFMPTLAGVRMIPQSLEAIWEAITEEQNSNG
ncbi:MAG: HIT domain-containing protein [Planctomycetota bacterium]